MNDIDILAIGRTVIELSAQKEQLLQALKQAQEQIKTLTPKTEAPKES